MPTYCADCWQQKDPNEPHECAAQRRANAEAQRRRSAPKATEEKEIAR